MCTDIRICFVGDSFVAGVGDPERRGWVGRLDATGAAATPPMELTTYNLGVRRETSAQIRDRWHREAVVRLPRESASAVVFSFGVNDTTHVEGAPRVEPGNSAAHLTSGLEQARLACWPALVVGPPPIADDRQNRRTSSLDRLFATVCADTGVRYVSVFADLARDPVWMREVAAGDGAHPGADGYRRLARLVQPEWQAWLAATARDRSGPITAPPTR